MTTMPESRRGRNLGLAAFAMVLMLGMMALPFLTSASTFSAGFTADHSGDPIQNDLYVAAFNSTITADVQGDVSLVVVNGTLDSTVGGSVHVIAGNITIKGTIQGTLYVVAGLVQLQGNVEGNVVVTGGRLELKDNARIGGDLVVFGAQSQIDGDVAGKLYGSVLLYEQDGSVSGNVELQSDRIQLGETATIGDDFRYQSQTDADVNNSAGIGGSEIHTDRSPWNGIGSGALAPYGQLMRLVWSMVVGAVLIGLAPHIFYRASNHASKMVAPGIWGALGIIIVPVLAVLALVSVFLIPVGVLMLVLLPIALYLSQIVVGITIGRSILPRSWRDGSRGFLLFALVIGVIIIGALRLAPVPFLNVVTMVIVTIWGFGALLMLLTDMTASRARASLGQRV